MGRSEMSEMLYPELSYYGPDHQFGDLTTENTRLNAMMRDLMMNGVRPRCPNPSFASTSRYSGAPRRALSDSSTAVRNLGSFCGDVQEFSRRKTRRPSKYSRTNLSGIREEETSVIGKRKSTTCLSTSRRQSKRKDKSRSRKSRGSTRFSQRNACFSRSSRKSSSPGARTTKSRSPATFSGSLRRTRTRKPTRHVHFAPMAEVILF